MRRRVFLLALFAFSLVWVFYYHHRQAPARALASARDETASVSGAPATERAESSPSEAAILLLADDQPSVAAVAALESAGVPYMVTRDAVAAARHPLVFIPFAETAVPLTPALLSLFEGFARRGGVLVVQAPAKDPWAPLTGLARAGAGRGRRRIDFDDPAAPASLASVPLAARGSQAPWTRALETRAALAGQPLALYDTGETAVLRRRLGSGTVYTLGVDLRDVVMRPHAGRSFDAGRAAQGLEPAADAWGLRLLRWYQEASPVWARLRAAPGSSTVVLAISHGVENGADLAKAHELAELEAELGVRAAWFFRAGPAEEPDEAQILDPRVGALVRALAAAGHEIGSHAVLHARDFEALPQAAPKGAGGYRPFLTVDAHAQEADMASEAAVSRSRLERVSGEGSVLGFRAPGLSYPTSLAAGLEHAGYLYDSSVPQHQSLSARPFFLPEARGFERRSSVVELSPAFEDERDLLRPDGAALDVALAAGAAYEATVVWALRPSAPGAAGALRRALSGRPPGTVVLRPVDAARFWRARAAARFALEPAGKSWRLTLDLPRGAPSLSFELSRPIRSCSSARLNVSCEGRLLTVTSAGPASGEASLRLE